MNIPKLRFKEFTGQWQEKKLGDIVSFHRGNSLSKSDLELSGKYKCIHYGELFTDYDEIITNIKYSTNIDTGSTSQAGDILMPTSDVTPQGLAKACSIQIEGVMLGGDINILRPNRSVNSVMLSYLLNYKKKKIMAIVSGTTVRHIYAKDLSKLEFYFSNSVAEQNKIANFLTTVDEKINKLEEKKKGFEKYKKGVMQAIFSQKIRFKKPDGSNYPDWEEKKLGEVVKFKNGKAHEQDISEDGDYIVINSKFISSDSRVKKFSNKQICPVYKDDIVFVMSDVPNGKAIAKCFLIDTNNKYTLNQRICALSSKKGISSPLFLINVINRNKYFLKFDNGVSQTNLKKDEVLGLPLIIPDEQEQEKIAEFFTSLDNKVDLINKELEQAKLFKKSLLQQMFV